MSHSVMRVRVVELAWGALIFTMFGLCTEIAFTGVAAGWDESFLGRVSLLMMPVYTLVYTLLIFLWPVLERWGMGRVLVRIPFLVISIYAIEWASGAAYSAFGLRPWHYDHGWASAWSGGHVTLYYLPVWVVFAVLVVPVSRLVREISSPARRAAGLHLGRRRV